MYSAVLIDKNTALLYCLNKTICQLTVKVYILQSREYIIYASSAYTKYFYTIYIAEYDT